MSLFTVKTLFGISGYYLTVLLQTFKNIVLYIFTK